MQEAVTPQLVMTTPKASCRRFAIPIAMATAARKCSVPNCSTPHVKTPNWLIQANHCWRECGCALTATRSIRSLVFSFATGSGIHAYGLNTEQSGLKLGAVARGEVIEISFSFDCWLGTDAYSVSFAVHSEDGISYDWIDGVLFFSVVCAPPG